MWLGAEVTVGPKWLGPRCLGPKWLGPRWLGAEVTRGRGGSGAEVSVNKKIDNPIETNETISCACRHIVCDNSGTS